MKFKSKISNFGKGRKIIEVPKCVRENYNSGDLVEVKLKEKTK